MRKLYFHPSIHWQLVFGIAWHSGKEYYINHWFITVWLGPFSCAIGLDDFDKPDWLAAPKLEKL